MQSLHTAHAFARRTLFHSFCLLGYSIFCPSVSLRPSAPLSRAIRRGSIHHLSILLGLCCGGGEKKKDGGGRGGAEIWVAFFFTHPLLIPHTPPAVSNDCKLFCLHLFVARNWLQAPFFLCTRACFHASTPPPPPGSERARGLGDFFFFFSFSAVSEHYAIWWQIQTSPLEVKQTGGERGRVSKRQRRKEMATESVTDGGTGITGQAQAERQTVKWREFRERQ